jgi:hypothetical protein
MHMVAARTLPLPASLAAEPGHPYCVTVLKALDVLVKVNLRMLILDQYMLPKF